MNKYNISRGLEWRPVYNAHPYNNFKTGQVEPIVPKCAAIKIDIKLASNPEMRNEEIYSM